MAADHRYQILQERDASYDGRLYFGVTSTGVYCRPSCPSRRPKPENVRYFDNPDAAEKAGFRPCLRCRPRNETSEAMIVRAVTEHLDRHLDDRVTLADLSAHLGFSQFHLQRIFKRATGITPKAYATSRRIEKLKSNLRKGKSVTESVFDAGFSTSSRAYERTNSELGMNPGAWRRKGEGVEIHFTVVSSEFGNILVGRTERGVCAVRLGDSKRTLEEEFRQDFAQANLVRDERLTNVVDQILVLIGGDEPRPHIPVDVRATAFQRRVWEQLQKIPRGETRSYSQVAEEIGSPTATRAVARACATNEVALIIPCHRVVGANGTLTGYRWGVEKKRKLLAKERAASEHSGAVA